MTLFLTLYCAPLVIIVLYTIFDLVISQDSDSAKFQLSVAFIPVVNILLASMAMISLICTVLIGINESMSPSTDN